MRKVVFDEFVLYGQGERGFKSSRESNRREATFHWVDKKQAEVYDSRGSIATSGA